MSFLSIANALATFAMLGSNRLRLRMQLDIERGAGLAIRETATKSLRIVPWRPHPDATFPDAVLYRGVQPSAAADENRAPEPA
jgi:hypothetical protein